MAGASRKHPVQLLQEIGQRSRKHAAGLPQQAEFKEQWSGIGFRLGGLRLLAPLGEVTEILTYPRMSRVPGAKSWVLGIANVRGNLLPIMDLDDYLRGRRAEPAKHSRILVIDQGGVSAGLLVDEVLGLKHFQDEERAAGPDAAVAPYVDRAYRDERESWAVFSMRKLAESPPFLQVAV